MRGRVGWFLLVGVGLLIVAAPSAFADHAEGEAFAEFSTREAPLPTVGWTVTGDADEPVEYGKTVGTFEVPERFDRFYLVVTEREIVGAEAEAMKIFFGESPSDDRVKVYGDDDSFNGAGTRACDPVAPSCSHQPSHKDVDPVPREDGSYEVKMAGVTTASYTVTAFGQVG